MNSSKRENWLDFTRGICAFCVLLAHNTTQLEIISLYNPYFLMLFFFISGYLFKVNAARKSKVDDNTARMQSIKQLGV